MTSVLGRELPLVTDEKLVELRGTTRPYTVVILKAGPRFRPPGPDRQEEVTDIIWTHGKRNVALHLAGILPIVCPIGDRSGVTGICIFAASPDEVREVMDADPGVHAGVFTYEIHPTRAYQGSILP